MAKVYRNQFPRTCQFCQKEFLARKKVAVYCSQACGQRARDRDSRIKQGKPETITIRCEACGKFFVTPKSRQDACIVELGHGRRFCSRSCYWKHRQGFPKPDTKTCSGCGRTFPFDAEHFYRHKGHARKWGLDPECKECRRKKSGPPNKKWAQTLKRDVLTAYGNGKCACVCCGESLLEFLALDHIHGDGKQEREKRSQRVLYAKLRREGYPQGRYRTLCFNCNWGAHYNGGVCPHELHRSKEHT